MASSSRRESIAAGVRSDAACHILRQGTMFTLSYLTACLLPLSNTTKAVLSSCTVSAISAFQGVDGQISAWEPFSAAGELHRGGV